MMIALDILDDGIRYTEKIVVTKVQIFFVGFLVLPGRVALTTENSSTEFTRACNTAVTAAIVAGRK